MQLVHGGDWAGYRAEFGRDALDFSANVSPLGLPEGVARAITAALPTADRYPDPLCRELRAKLALHEGVPAEQILCGNGAADLIFRLVWAKKPRRALVTAPTFAEYATALESVGCTVERFFLREQEDFAVTDAFCAAIRPGVDMVFLCQPNNPTGQLTALPLVEQILHRCAACGTLLVVDECFLDFLPDHALHTAKGLLGEGDLVILKAFTKLYGMAGVRLGYALSADTALLEQMQACGQPWGVSSLAQAAGLAALEETAYVEKVRALIAEQRPRLTAGLRALGLRVLDGRANYLLFQAPETLGEALRQRGAVLRSCANYPGLGPGWYRTAVRTGPENEQNEQGKVHHGAGNHERCRQKPAVRRPLPHFCAGRLPRGSLQEPEHGAEQLCHPGWAGNGPGTGGAGAGRRHRAGCADEPHSAQAQQ